MPPSSDSSRTQICNFENWSWPGAINLLSDPNDLESFQISRVFWNLQGRLFGQLLDAIENIENPVTWDRARLEIDVPIPFEWDTELPLSQVTQKKYQQKKKLFITLRVLTAGATVRVEKDGFHPLLPPDIAEALQHYSLAEAKRCLDQWFDFEAWLKPCAYGTAGTKENPTITGTGNGNTFRCGLFSSISPQFIDFSKRKSHYHLTTALPWAASKEGVHPGAWNRQEKAAFRNLVSDFFSELCRARSPSNLPQSISIPVKTNPDRGRNLERFDAYFCNTSGRSFVDDTAFRPLKKSILKDVPSFALISQAPTLEITDGHGKLNFYAAMEMTALMEHPDSMEHRSEFLVKSKLVLLSDWHQALMERKTRGKAMSDSQRQRALDELADKLDLFSPISIRDSIDAPSFMDIKEGAVRSYLEGVLVGEILLFLLSCSQHSPQHLSLRKAIFCCSHLVKIDRDGTGEFKKHSQTAIKAAWGRLKGVAHYWAANQTVAQYYEKDLPSFVKDQESLLKFLAIAEGYRRLGVTCFARAQRVKGGPILDPSTTWRLPRDLKLPEGDFETGPLPEKVQTLLSTYRTDSSPKR